MIIKSIQIKDNSIAIDYAKPSATGMTDVFTLKSQDDARPELFKAFSNLQAILKRNFSFLEEHNIPYLIQKFKFKASLDDETCISKISAEGYIQEDGKENVLKIKTEDMPVDYNDGTFVISVQDLVDECIKFIMGRRAQDSLFNDSEE